MVQLYMFFIRGKLYTISEGYENAASEERYLTTQFNHITLISILAQSYTEAWLEVDQIDDFSYQL